MRLLQACGTDEGFAGCGPLMTEVLESADRRPQKNLVANDRGKRENHRINPKPRPQAHRARIRFERSDLGQSPVTSEEIEKWNHRNRKFSRLAALESHFARLIERGARECAMGALHHGLPEIARTVAAHPECALGADRLLAEQDDAISGHIGAGNGCRCA